MNHVLIVDDEAEIRDSLESILTEEGYAVASAATAHEALTLLADAIYDVVLLDIWLPDRDGLDALADIRHMDTAHLPEVIIISGHGTIEAAVRATKLGAYDFLEKPLSLDRTLIVLKNAINARQLREDNQEFVRQLSFRASVTGNSVPMKALRQQIKLMAPTNRRAPTPPPPAGTPTEKRGTFERADGGTLFLDEVGDMSLKTQARVLRALDEQRFLPVGATHPVHVDVRVIAATNKDLEEEIARGNFREDLFYRLNVIPFFVPPLRDRKEDIPLLVKEFLQEFGAQYGRPHVEMHPDALDALRQYHWPGNVRELRNLVERVLILNPKSQRIERKHLPMLVYREPARDGAKSAARGEEFSTLLEAREAYERDYILKKLDECHGNMSRTAEALGLERSHLYRKMKALGVSIKE